MSCDSWGCKESPSPPAGQVAAASAGWPCARADFGTGSGLSMSEFLTEKDYYVLCIIT